MDDGSSLWSFLDRAVLGRHSIDVEGPFSAAVATLRLATLTETQPSYPDEPYLVVTVRGGSVTARYELPVLRTWLGQRRSSPPLLNLRPVFRGSLGEQYGGSHLTGSFGLNTATRAASIGALAAVVLLIIDPFLHLTEYLGIVPWAVPVVFIVMCLATRASGDDAPYWARNLEYAMRGDAAEGSAGRS